MVDKLIEEVEKLQEAKNLLEYLYYGIGPYKIRPVIEEHFNEHESRDLIRGLDHFFNFDDSE